MESIKKDWMLPVSVVLSSALIAASIYFTGGIKIVNQEANVAKTDEKEIILAPITKDDHILGRADSDVAIVLYTDVECPYCKKFHETMKQVMEHYDGKVAWVFRNYPIDSLHRNARIEAEAMECAGKVGGELKFWEMMDIIFETTESNDGLDISTLPALAEKVGVDKAEFESCLNNREMKEKVELLITSGNDAGAEGVPYSIILGPNGEKIPLEGAYPLNVIKEVIDRLLKDSAE